MAGRLYDWVPERGHRTLTEQASAALRDGILTGQLKAGERLSIDDLARVLDMSKMPIREALRRLETAGLVETTPYRGTRVTELSIKDLREVYQARLALEPLAVRTAAERFGEDDAAKAGAALLRLDELDEDTSEAWAAHTEFHFSFYAAADSTWLLRLIEPLWETSERYRFATEIRPRSAISRKEHDRILRACVGGDADRAGVELYNHLARTANMMAASMGGEALFTLLER